MVDELLASHGLEVLFFDRRPLIGGNEYDLVEAQGILIHPYGPHIFHTNGVRIAEYLSRFTQWRFYEHRVLAKVGDLFVPMPINIDTVNRLYGLSLTEATIGAFFEAAREPRSPIKTSEDVVLDAVGRDLYEKLFRGYTRKQWGLEPSQLSASVAARVPARTNHDDRYFTDTFQHMPLDGYTRMFERILDHPRIRVDVGVDFFRIRHRVRARHIVYTGPIDAYFDHCFGKLPYRSIEFRHEHLAIPQYQPVGTVNFPNDHGYTRITEFKHLTGQNVRGTSIVREFPCDEGDPYYPVPRPENEAVFKQYETLAKATPEVSFVGRLAQYRYYNMDQCVGAALKAAESVIARLGTQIPRRLEGSAARVQTNAGTLSVLPRPGIG